jgi:hypothetical protein
VPKEKITMSKKREVGTLALCIALLPPLWAVLAPYLHVQTGAVALICAGLYVTNGNRLSDAVKISVGFLLGDLWAWLAVRVMAWLSWNPDVELFCVLFVLGGAAVLCSAALPKYIFCPAWLCGWAIGLTILSPLDAEAVGSYVWQIAVAMLVGVWYVGAFLNAVQQAMIKFLQKKETSNR